MNYHTDITTLTSRIKNDPLQMPDMFDTLDRLIGNTPLLAVQLRYQGVISKIYAKLEYFNLSGSIKDRMALEVLRAAYWRGALKHGDMIVEATSGNAGIAFCALGRALGHPVRIYMPDWMSTERIALMRSYGADVILISKEEGGFLGCIHRAETLADTHDNVFLPRQFTNQDNCSAHCKTTGPEILMQLAKWGRSRPTAFIAGVGTGGTIMGVGRALRAQNPDIKIHPLEPAESPTLTTGYKVGHHRIQGVSDEFIPDIVCLETLDDVVCVHDGDAIIMAQKLAAELGLAVGISSGANLLGALKIQRKMHTDSPVVTIFCDDNKKYLTTDLTKAEPVKSGYLSPEIELLDYEICQK